MKKLITIILILAMLLPAAALAEDPDLAGCWVAFIPTSVSIGYGNFAYILVLNEDGSMVELQTSSNSAERTLTALTTRAQWFFYDGKVYIRDEHGNQPILDYHDGMIWVKADVMEFGLVKTQDFNLTQMNYVGE